ncbi:hypothetical protein, partial [Klebsiella pneumoniae]|uniref:hypothetical protein n=1 Tax=Klebsiella pneumoniae TaxID=573 RepID=UPI0024AFC175
VRPEGSPKPPGTGTLGRTGQSEIATTNSKVAKAPTEFKGFKDLTTKVLGRLEGRSEVSKQFISDLTNSGDLKQAERDLIRSVLSDYPD